ncbi:hemolysin expression modulating protein [Escherichia coli TW10509]|nr:hemolysin expression modulating protein [Escherichia coli TW10509]
MKTRKEWLYQLRKCTSRETLEKVIEINSYKLSLSESEAFFLRLIIVGQNWL